MKRKRPFTIIVNGLFEYILVPVWTASIENDWAFEIINFIYT